MTLKFGSQQELLKFVSSEGFPLVHGQGYHWFWRKFTPALRKASMEPNPSREMIADCYYVAGDVHDVNNAPKSAIEQYEKALEFDPKLGSAHREIANMYSRIGDHREALRHSERALELIPNDEHAQSDHSEIIEEPKCDDAGLLYRRGDAVWEAYELLAQSDPQAALDRLADRRDDEAQRARVCCYGALKKNEEYLNGWKNIVKACDSIQFEFHDWFFMDEKNFYDPSFWKVLFESNAKFSGFFEVFEGLEESKRFSSLSEHESIKLRLEYLVYAQSEDAAGLRRLHKKYPEWKELSETVNK